MHIYIFGNTKYIFSFFNNSNLVSYLTTYVLLFTYMLCLCAVVVSPDLSEYTFLDQMTDNTFTVHSGYTILCIQCVFDGYAPVIAVHANAIQFLSCNCLGPEESHTM